MPLTTHDIVTMFSKQLKKLLLENDVSVVRLSKATKINTKTLYNYLDNRSPRNLNHVLVICKHFNVTSDYLLFGIENQNMNNKDEVVPFGTFEVFMRKVQK